MKSKVERQTVDLSAFPDLVVIYLGMRLNAWAGLKTLFGLGPQIKKITYRIFRSAPGDRQRVVGASPTR